MKVNTIYLASLLVSLAAAMVPMEPEIRNLNVESRSCCGTGVSLVAIRDLIRHIAFVRLAHNVFFIF